MADTRRRSMIDDKGAFWIFGYGSLIWRPDFRFAESRPARVEGWVRRFWQGSTDHRGVPGAPGRVVTLLPEREAVCWGVAYRIAGPDRDSVVAHLDYREKGGYALERVRLIVSGLHGEQAGFVYIATPDNPNYLGPAEETEIARIAAISRGPSGPNDEYVIRLAGALREMNADDPHVFAIEDHLRRFTRAG